MKIFRRPIHKWENNTETDLKELRHEDMDLIHPVLDTFQV
jgi:hypothetical protein